MNADGSAGVRTDISGRSQGPFLVAMGWGAIGARAILLAIAGVLALLVIRGQREPSEGREHTGAPRPPEPAR